VSDACACAEDYGGLTVFEAILKDVKKIDNRTHGGTEAAAGIGLDERILL
jgi:hypothetical protein